MKKIDYTDLIGMDVPDILRLAKDERWSWDKLGKALFIKNVLINDEQTDSLDTISDRLKGINYNLENTAK